jgi:hypothetical protein
MSPITTPSANHMKGQSFLSELGLDGTSMFETAASATQDETAFADPLGDTAASPPPLQERLSPVEAVQVEAPQFAELQHDASQRHGVAAEGNVEVQPEEELHLTSPATPKREGESRTEAISPMKATPAEMEEFDFSCWFDGSGCRSFAVLLLHWKY